MERTISTISEMTVKQLTDAGQVWTHYLQTCTHAYNSFATSALNGLSPFQITFGKPLKVY